MPCCGHHKVLRTVKDAGGNDVPAPKIPRDGFDILPYEPCAFCAEKHISDAWDLSRECGYEFPNRQTIIGALGSAERHLFARWRPLAEMVRAARHLVQLRKESEIDWMPILKEIDELANEAAKELKAEELKNKKTEK